MGTRTLFRLSALQARRTTNAGRHADGGGLYLQINEAGNKSWVFKYTHGGRVREMGLGGSAAVKRQTVRSARSSASPKYFRGQLVRKCSNSVHYPNALSPAAYARQADILVPARLSA
jgi:hypothetical protein